MVAHSPGRSPGRRIKHAASVACAVCAKPVNLQGPAVVKITADGPAYNGNAHNIFSVGAANRKFVPCDRLMVSVMLLYKSIGLL